MSAHAPQWWRAVGAVLIDPVAAYGAAISRPEPWRLFAFFVAVQTVLGLATLPRQVAVLELGLPLTGNPATDAQLEALRAGIVRLMVVDRVLPQPAVLLGAVLLVLGAEPVLMLAQEHRRALIAVAILGLAPLVVGRIGELAITYLVSSAGHGTPGDAISAPHRFLTGPKLLWRGDGPAPQWLEVLDARANLVSLGCVLLWSIGLRQLDGGRWAAWHVALPLACLVAGGLASWALAPVVLPIVLR